MKATVKTQLNSIVENAIQYGHSPTEAMHHVLADIFENQLVPALMKFKRESVYYDIDVDSETFKGYISGLRTHYTDDIPCGTVTHSTLQILTLNLQNDIVHLLPQEIFASSDAELARVRQILKFYSDTAAFVEAAKSILESHTGALDPQCECRVTEHGFVPTLA